MYTMVKLDQMVLKGVNWIHNDNIRLYGLEKSQLGNTIIKLGPKFSSLHKYSVFNKSTVLLK